MKVPATILLILSLCQPAASDHFRGATISWRALAEKNKVEFYFRMGWTLGKLRPGCNDLTKIGRFLPFFSPNRDKWDCYGCNSTGPVFVHSIDYVCSSFSQEHQWEQGENRFNFTFPGEGPYSVAYKNTKWMQLGVGKGGGNYSIETTVDLRYRNDTNFPNSSPQTLADPIYLMPFGCTNHLLIPTADEDGDAVKCRWAEGAECESVCHGLPGASLDEDSCTLTFHTLPSNNYSADAWYGVALTVEDFPRYPVTLGDRGQIVTPAQALSKVPLQFLIKTSNMSTPCLYKPEFVFPTPQDGEKVTVPAHGILSVQFYASSTKNSSAKITAVHISGILGATTSPVTPDDQGRPNVFFVKVTWTPQSKDAGSHILCADAMDSSGRTGEPRCVKVIAWVQDPCLNNPCVHSGVCSTVGDIKFKCTCPADYSGRICEKDRCSSSPCANGGTCTVLPGAFSCQCTPDWGGPTCDVSATTTTSSSTSTTTTPATATTTTSSSATTTTTRATATTTAAVPPVNPIAVATTTVSTSTITTRTSTPTATRITASTNTPGARSLATSNIQPTTTFTFSDNPAPLTATDSHVTCGSGAGHVWSGGWNCLSRDATAAVLGCAVVVFVAVAVALCRRFVCSKHRKDGLPATQRVAPLEAKEEKSIPMPDVAW